MAIIFNVLPVDDYTVRAEDIIVGSFFGPAGKQNILYLKLGAADTSGKVPVMLICPGKFRAVEDFVPAGDRFVLVEDITLSFPGVSPKGRNK